MQRHAEAERWIGVNKNVGTLERHASEMRREQGGEQADKRRWCPTTLCYESMRCCQGKNAALELVRQVLHGPRAFGCLSEERKKLGKDIAGTVAQFADHHFMTMIELAAPNGAGQHVCYGGHKRSIIIVESDEPCRVSADHAIGPPILSGDRHADATSDTMVVQ